MDIKLVIPNDFLQDEYRDGYLVSSAIKKVWAVEIDLIEELLRVCDKYQLKVYCCAGTILGAVRHAGYIPWDDDVDLMMFREDYEKLCSISRQAFSAPYFFQTEKTDPGSARGHAQLRNSSTTAILETEKGKKVHFNQGIFIDIFPLDHYPDNPVKRKEFMENERKKLRYSRWLLNGPADTETKVKQKIKKAAYALNKVIPLGKRLYNSFEKTAQKYNHMNTQWVGIVALGEERFVWKESDITDTVPMNFEMIKVPVPQNYDNLLKKTYGDWRTPIKGGSVHGGVFFDPDRPYTEYI